MKIIVGLGNPGEEYANTMHNAGFMVLDKLAEKYNISIKKNRFDGLVGAGEINDEKVILVKPLTYMNLSGECVLKVIKFYKADLSNLIVIYDDIDVEMGKIKVKPSGSPGSHNGMKNITTMLESEDFIRIRIGTSKPDEFTDLKDYVLMSLTDEEKSAINGGVELGAKAVEGILTKGIEKTMNEFNSRGWR